LCEGVAPDVMRHGRSWKNDESRKADFSGGKPKKGGAEIARRISERGLGTRIKELKKETRGEKMASE